VGTFRENRLAVKALRAAQNLWRGEIEVKACLLFDADKSATRQDNTIGAVAAVGPETQAAAWEPAGDSNEVPLSHNSTGAAMYTVL
jgi:hypothetical protein